MRKIIKKKLLKSLFQFLLKTKCIIKDLSVKYILNKLDTKGVNELPIQSTSELQNIHNLMNEFDEVLNENKGNVLIRNIV